MLRAGFGIHAYFKVVEGSMVEGSTASTILRSSFAIIAKLVQPVKVLLAQRNAAKTGVADIDPLEVE